jgi:hypothetical protein
MVISAYFTYNWINPMTSTTQSTADTSLSFYLHGHRILPVVTLARQILSDKQRDTKSPVLSRQEKTRLAEQLRALELRETHDGVNFSRFQIDAVLRSRDKGELIEFETMGPYLVDYIAFGGIMTADNLTAEDAIGLRLAQALRSVFPNGRLVSLYDEYNTRHYNDQGNESIVEFTKELKSTFRSSLIALFASSGAIAKDATEGGEFWLVAESQKVTDAEKLAIQLESLGYIERNGQEVLFVNELAENPLHYRIRLRTKNGKWLCEALDASAFLQPQNWNITHLVILPDSMKDQQDRVWEILRVLGIDPAKYHNIFFDSNLPLAQISQTILTMFKGAETR